MRRCEDCPASREERSVCSGVNEEAAAAFTDPKEERRDVRAELASTYAVAERMRWRFVVLRTARDELGRETMAASAAQARSDAVGQVEGARSRRSD